MNVSATQPTGIWGRWSAYPLYLRILGALLLGLVTGLMFGKTAIIFDLPAKLILQLLGALAPPLILVAVVHVLMTTEFEGSAARRLVTLLLLNTVMAILIGLFVANVVRPGHWTKEGALKPPATAEEKPAAPGAKPALAKKLSPVDVVINNIPKSILGPLGNETNIIGVIIIAVAFGIALRAGRDKPLHTVRDLVEVGYATLLVVLHWIIQLVPFGVFAIVAKVVGTAGFSPFVSMGVFVLAVILALLLQTGWYLARIKFGSWAKPTDVISGMKDALVMAFSTASSTTTMPVTYACLRNKVGISEKSASLGALVGANFNNDGTALYEAMAALFIAQVLRIDLSITQQLMVVLTSIVASVGAAGIPEAGLVTMTLVFTAVGLPTEYIVLLLAVDWFLDRCRTTINVLGDVNVSCLLDGRKRPEIAASVVPAAASASPGPADA